MDVPLFVTIGSPLGITEVQDQVKRLTGQRSLAVPACVREWVNVADPLDPVALDKDLQRRVHAVVAHPQRPAWQPGQSAPSPLRHRYLRTPPVHNAVHDAVSIGLFQPVADFVVTRDLVRNLENCPPEERHPVLIELSQEPTQAAGPARSWTRSGRASTAHVRRLTRASDEVLNLEELRHFVAAKLSRTEVETLASTRRCAASRSGASGGTR